MRVRGAGDGEGEELVGPMSKGVSKLHRRANQTLHETTPPLRHYMR